MAFITGRSGRNRPTAATAPGGYFPALSANHLAALLLPEGLRHLYIAQDADPAGARAAEHLAARAVAGVVDVRPLAPVLGDCNEDLVAFGIDDLRAHLLAQLAPADAGELILLRCGK